MQTITASLSYFQLLIVLTVFCLPSTILTALYKLLIPWAYRNIAERTALTICLFLCSQSSFLTFMISSLYKQKKRPYFKVLPQNMIFLKIAGAVRIELTLTVLETAVLPLNYAPLFILCNSFLPTKKIITYTLYRMQAFFYILLFSDFILICCFF